MLYHDLVFCFRPLLAVASQKTAVANCPAMIEAATAMMAICWLPHVATSYPPFEVPIGGGSVQHG